MYLFSLRVINPDATTEIGQKHKRTHRQIRTVNQNNKLFNPLMTSSSSLAKRLDNNFMPINYPEVNLILQKLVLYPKPCVFFSSVCFSLEEAFSTTNQHNDNKDQLPFTDRK